MKRLVLSWAVLALLFAFTSACITVPPAIGTGGELTRDVPLPKNVKIITPDKSIPPELAVFSGKWGGVWDDINLNHILVVEEIDHAGAKVVYAHGTSPGDGMQGRWYRIKGLFVKGALVLETQQTRISYMYKNGILHATYESWRSSRHIYTTSKLSRLE
jgi:hypothetical protein